jgi:hypothetical protein
MGKFKQWLNEQGRHAEANEKIRGKRIAAWRMAVEKLFKDIRAWLKEDDPEQYLQLQGRIIKLDEEGLGAYPIDALTVYLSHERAEIRPVALNVVRPRFLNSASEYRAEGRVDMTDSRELKRYLLYRVISETRPEKWVIVNSEVPAEPDLIRDLTKDAFEEALQSLLS